MVNLFLFHLCFITTLLVFMDNPDLISLNPRICYGYRKLVKPAESWDQRNILRNISLGNNTSCRNANWLVGTISVKILRNFRGGEDINDTLRVRYNYFRSFSGLGWQPASTVRPGDPPHQRRAPWPRHSQWRTGRDPGQGSQDKTHHIVTIMHFCILKEFLILGPD